MKIVSKNENNALFKAGQLLRIVNPKSDWNNKVNKKVTNLIGGFDSEFIIVYDFSESFLEKEVDKKQTIGKRIYIPSGTTCLYLTCDIISTEDTDLTEEDIVFELHRVLIENKTYWVFDIFLQQN